MASVPAAGNKTKPPAGVGSGAPSHDAGAPHADPPLPRRLRWILAAAMVVTVVAGGTLLLNLWHLQDTTERLKTSRSVQEALERLQSSLVDAETGQRGYLLTGRPAYLEPYERAKTVYPVTMANLSGMAVNDPELARGLAELRPVIDEKMAIIERTIARYAAQGDIVPSDRGRQTMDRIREIIARMRVHANAEVASTSAQSDRRTVATFSVASLAALLGVAALLLIYHAVEVEHRNRNIAEEALRDRTALIDAVADGTDDWIFVKDREGRLLFVNRAVCRAFGRDASELLGTLPASYVADPAEAAAIQRNDLRVMDTATAERIEQTITTRAGTRTYASTKTPRIDADGHVIGLIGIATDITDRKVAEEMLAQSNRRLSATVAEKTAQLAELTQHLLRVSEDERKQLAAELHDELGALHTVITLDLESIRKDFKADMPALDARLRDVLALVQQAREIKRRIIADLRPLLLEHFGLMPALGDYAQMWATSSKVAVSTELRGTLPPLSQGLALALFRVVQESLNNVAKYAQATAVKIAIDVNDDELCLTVEDDGVGIAPEALERPRSHGIVGMQQRVASFGGTLDIRRGERGHGTVVAVHIPLPAVA